MPGALKQLMEHAGQQTATAFRVRFPSGFEYRNSEAAPAFTMTFKSVRAQRRTVLYGPGGLLEAYFDGDIDIDGNLAKALAVGMEAGLDHPNLLVRMRNRWHEFMHNNASRRTAQKNAEYHYALPPEFYKFWLDDPLMLYTCAYWKEGTRTPEEAQRNKCD